MVADQLRDEIARNFDAFQRALPEHLAAHAGRFALLKAGKVEDYFDTPGDADRAGWTRFPDHLYSIQQVTAEPIGLGLYANAVD